MSKFVMVQFPDATDISTLTVDSTVTVTKTVPVTGGTVIMAGSMQNPPAQMLIPHTHAFDAPPAVSGPAIP